MYDGEDPSKFEGWLDAVEQACNMTDRNLRKELMKKSSGAIRETILMIEHSLDRRRHHLQAKARLFFHVHHE